MIINSRLLRMSARKKSIEKVVELRMWIFRVSRNTVLLVGIAAFRNVDTFSKCLFRSIKVLMFDFFKADFFGD